MKLKADPLRQALGLSQAETPVALILEGSWWQQQRNRLRLGYLEGVRELPFPEMHLGYYQDRPILYSCVYGAPRAVEPVHIFGSLGTPLAIQIGSCGAIQPHVRTGDVVLPSKVCIGEGASQYYTNAQWAHASPLWLERANNALQQRGLQTHQGLFITTSALFAQPPERVAAWAQAGYLGVDMETSAVFSVAQTLGMSAVSLVFAWDELYQNRSFLDEFSAAEKARQEQANTAIFEVALALATQAEVAV